MKPRCLVLTFAFVVVIFLSSSFAQTPVTSKDLVAEGVIIGFQRNTRYRVMPYIGGIATPVEHWVVRIDQWPYNAGALADQKYILVEYWLYFRNLTDCDINAKKLRFTLRQPEKDDHPDCLGLAKDSNEPLSKYDLTVPGKDAQIPSLSTLPCLTANQAPLVLE